MNQTAPLKLPTSHRFMPWMLRSAFHIFMSGILLITVTGRKSGRSISTPVNYARDGETLLVTSTVDRTWWKNLRSGAKVTLLVKCKTYRADANVIEDRAAVERELLRFFRLVKRTIAGIHLDEDGQPTKPHKFAQVRSLEWSLRSQTARRGKSTAPLNRRANHATTTRL